MTCDVTQGCKSSACSCDVLGTWSCDDDCGGGVCTLNGVAYPDCTYGAWDLIDRTLDNLSEQRGGCTSVVLLNNNFTPLGYRHACGVNVPVTEASAAATLAGFIWQPLLAGQLGNHFVFIDGEAHATAPWGVVSGYTGLIALVASYPGLSMVIDENQEWLPAWHLEYACPMGAWPSALGIDLGNGGSLPQATVDRAIQRVWSTPLPMALLTLWGRGPLNQLVVSGSGFYAVLVASGSPEETVLP